MIPPKLLADILNDKYYEHCARKIDGGCEGRITFEHALEYGGRQINEKFAIIPLCAKHHGVIPFLDDNLLDKEKNQWIALMRATDEELERYSKIVNLKAKRNRLTRKYNFTVKI